MFNLFQKNFNQNNNNNINMINNNNCNLNESKGQEEILPRDVNNTLDPFPNESATINFVFSSNTGSETVIRFPNNKTLNELMLFYASKMGINEDMLGKQIIFLLNAVTLHENDQRQLKNIFRHNMIHITVIDTYFLVGGKENYKLVLI